MLHPSYTDLMEVVNANTELGEEPVVQSRYSIVLATAKRARQLINGGDSFIDDSEGRKALSVAIDELYQGKIKIVSDH